MNDELYVFWEYSEFPYCLSGIATSFKGDRAYLPAYLMYIKPFLVMDVENGRKLATSISDLGKERYDAVNKLQDEFNNKLSKLINIPNK